VCLVSDPGHSIEPVCEDEPKLHRAGPLVFPQRGPGHLRRERKRGNLVTAARWPISRLHKSEEAL
jgi:hypothetical protein